MLLQSSPPSRNVDEATILQVDHQHCLCKVRTLRGQVLHQVRWLTPFGGSTRGSDRISPHMGDRVMIEHGLGSPVIVGFFPRLQTSDGATPLSLANGEVAIDLGSYSGANLAVPDQNKPKDSVGGDRLISSIGGALLGLLRGGTVLLRSSRTSEILLSKYQNLVRIVSRNFEHFTDTSSDVVKNFKGRVYRYVGYSKDFVEAKNEIYKYNQYFGDVVAAEAVKTNYVSFEGTLPAVTPVIFKEQVLNEAQAEIMRRTVELSGDEEVWIKVVTPDGDPPIFTRMKATGGVLTFSYADQNTITVKKDFIQAIRSDGAELILDPQGLRANFQDGHVNMSSGSVVTTFSGNTVTVDAGKIEAKKGGTTMIVDGSNASLVSGGHSCIVSASGVALA